MFVQNIPTEQLFERMTFFENYSWTPLDLYNGLSQVYCIKTRRKNLLVYEELSILLASS